MTQIETVTNTTRPVPMARYISQQLDKIGRIIGHTLNDENWTRILGPEMDHLRSQDNRVERANSIVRLALLNDVLCVAETAILADGKVTKKELELIYPLVRASAAYYARTRRPYKDFAEIGPDRALEFLRKHHADTSIFGGTCAKTEWLGLQICRRIADVTGDPDGLDGYERMLVRVLDDVTAVGGLTTEELAVRERVQKAIGEIARPKKENDNTDKTPGADLRVSAFCSPTAPEVFHAIAHAHQIWERDPLDVESIHAEARSAFERVLDRLNRARERGRILLVRGASGSGKTHLMRVFRTSVHSRRLGFTGYLQMSTQTDHYARYVLAKLIDSLELPYDAPEIETSSLTCLANNVVEAALNPAAISSLREELLSNDELARVIAKLADRIIADPRFSKIELDLLRALLYLQRREPAINARVLKYLRCEHLNVHDRELIGDIAPKSRDEDPLRMIEQLGSLAVACSGGSLVLLVDQLEDIFHMKDAKESFRRATDVLRHIADHVPSALIVIACLDDYYTKLQPHLSRATIDRIENDPEPVRLTAHRSVEEIEALVARRLRHLYDEAGARPRDSEPMFPFVRADLQKLTNMRTRDVLDWCLKFQRRSIALGRIAEAPELGPDTAAEGTEPKPLIAYGQRWNDFRAAFAATNGSDDTALINALSFALETWVRDLHPDRKIRTSPQEWTLKIDLDEQRLMVGMCNRGPQGGGFAAQLQAFEKRTQGALPIVARCSDFPASPKTVAARKLGELIAKGGRRVVLEDSDFRTIDAFRKFRETHQKDAAFTLWVKEEHPLEGVRAVREILALERPASVEPVPVISTPKPRAEAAAPIPAPAPREHAGTANAIAIGHTRSLRPEPVTIDREALTTHAAFLGSTKSGKTTLALRIIERLLLSGVPAVLIDRKGDLATYASPAAFDTEEKAALREKIDVRLYTPGDAQGSPLSIAIVPRELGKVSAQERTKLARYSATALGSMMGYGDGPSDQARLGILAKAIEILSEVCTDDQIGIEHIVDLLDKQDPTLVQAIGRLDTKHFTKLIDHLETLRITRGELIAENSAPLSAAALFGKEAGASADRTRLSIISTKFLGDNANVDFWISRLLVETARWASQNPSDRLQGVMLFDEADIYLPATRKPATKEPMQDLLRRARSAGIGVFLATQSPGDLDYKCRDNVRTWFVGRVAERTAVEKMRPLLSDCRTSFASKLAGAGTGEFFYLSGGEVVEMKAERSFLETRQLPEGEILALARATLR